MHCDLCGTKVKVVGHITKHYEPVVDREILLKILKEHQYFKSTFEELADKILSAMYGEGEE